MTDTNGLNFNFEFPREQKMAWGAVVLGLVLIALIYPLNWFSWLIESTASNGAIWCAITWVVGASFLFIGQKKHVSPVPFPLPWPALIAVFELATRHAGLYTQSLPGFGPSHPLTFISLLFALAGVYQIIRGHKWYWIWIGFFFFQIIFGFTLLLLPAPFLIPMIMESFQTPDFGLDKPPKTFRIIAITIITLNILYDVLVMIIKPKLGGIAYDFVRGLDFFFLFVSIHLQLMLMPGWWRWELIKLRAIAGLCLIYGAIALFCSIKGINQVDLFPLIAAFIVFTSWPIMYLLPLLTFPISVISPDTAEGLRALYRLIMVKLGWADKLAKKMDAEWTEAITSTSANPVQESEAR